MKIKTGLFCFLSLLFLSVLGTSCTTRPVELPEKADPLGALPSEDDFYLLARPSEYPDLSLKILENLLPLDPSEIYPALGRTKMAVLSGQLGQPLAFSGKMEGDYPAYFVRRSLRKSAEWSKEKAKTYKGPQDILASTLYKNTLLAASGEARLQNLDAAVMMGRYHDKPVLSRENQDWWEGGTAALLFYLPDLSVFPLPEGFPVIPVGSSVLVSMIPGDQEQYTLQGEFVFTDAGSIRLWSLGLRIFLAGRLGLSELEEERLALPQINLKIDGKRLILNNWTMSASAWGHFISSF